MPFISCLEKISALSSLVDSRLIVQGICDSVVNKDTCDLVVDLTYEREGAGEIRAKKANGKTRRYIPLPESVFGSRLVEAMCCSCIGEQCTITVRL